MNFDLAVDIDPVLTSSAPHNFPKTRHILSDLSKADKYDVENWTSGREVDLVFGGPPCQGFSLIGKRDASDPRRDLLSHYFRIVSLLSPKVFVMENVAGLASPSTMPLLEAALAKWVPDYSLLETKILDASNYGAPTKRRRIFVVGFDKNRIDPLSWTGLKRSEESPLVQDAISDLVGARLVRLEDNESKIWRLDKRRAVSAYAARLRREEAFVDGMETTKHTEAVLRRFANVPQGGVDPVGRYPRLSWEGLCPTLRAGTGSDKGSFQAVRPLHPEENRVITVREAARLQGFPDRHRFHPTKWHSFRMIGNSVSPPLACEILKWVSSNTDAASHQNREAA